jgi:hypothetical protein
LQPKLSTWKRDETIEGDSRSITRPPDGGGEYEVAGIDVNDHPLEAAQLCDMIQEGRFEEAEEYARQFIASYTDVVQQWTDSTALEAFLRFNRGPVGAARIFQIALGVKVDGYVGPITKEEVAKIEPEPFLTTLRSARETYERKWLKASCPRPANDPGIPPRHAS